MKENRLSIACEDGYHLLCEGTFEFGAVRALCHCKVCNHKMQKGAGQDAGRSVDADDAHPRLRASTEHAAIPPPQGASSSDTDGVRRAHRSEILPFVNKLTKADAIVPVASEEAAGAVTASADQNSSRQVSEPAGEQILASAGGGGPA